MLSKRHFVTVIITYVTFSQSRLEALVLPRVGYIAAPTRRSELAYCQHDTSGLLFTAALCAAANNDQVAEAVSVTGVTLKLALDSNWGVAELDELVSTRFTCPESLDMVHRLRRASDAVLVGRGTVVRDDCSLLVRRGVQVEKQPLRVILDPRLSILLEQRDEQGECYQVLSDGATRTVIYHSVTDADVASLALLDGVEIVYQPSTLPTTTNAPQSPSSSERHFSPQLVLEHLRNNFDVQHVMVEGGPATARRFLQEGLVDRAILVRAPMKFSTPFPSGLDNTMIKEAGLEFLGTSASGVDTIEYWSRPGLPWPAETLSAWP